MSRKKIGLIFSYDEHWIGGTYYIINLVNALNQLEDYQKPQLIIFSNKKDFAILNDETEYRYLEFCLLDDNPRNKLFRVINAISKKLFARKLVVKKYNKKIDVIFPYRNIDYLNKIPSEKRIYWIPDFQEKHFPDFYSQEHLVNEKKRNTDIVMNSKKLVLSSYAALDDLKTYYPHYKTTPFVVHFAVTIPPISADPEVLTKFSLPSSFYFAPNQFWQHKNHFIVIKAVKLLKDSGTTVTVAFSGKEHDYRSPGYADSLKQLVIDLGLSEQIKFLGFLDRKDQVSLMKLAKAIIQPSLFEGWSTVIEEAMALNKLVIAADLDVNKEQLQENGYFFQRNNENDLAEIINQVNNAETVITYNYTEKKLAFARDFMQCLN